MNYRRQSDQVCQLTNEKIQLELINHLPIQKINFIQETFITGAHVSATPLCTTSINKKQNVASLNIINCCNILSFVDYKNRLSS